MPPRSCSWLISPSPVPGRISAPAADDGTAVRTSARATLHEAMCDRWFTAVLPREREATGIARAAQNLPPEGRRVRHLDVVTVGASRRRVRSGENERCRDAPPLGPVADGCDAGTGERLVPEDRERRPRRRARERLRRRLVDHGRILTQPGH